MDNQSSLAKFLELSIDDLDEIGLYIEDLKENHGNSGEALYNHYFLVPECTPLRILEEKNWTIGQFINVPLLDNVSF
ncbi:MAG: hypothetical protein ACRCT7_18735 [Shewanella sp.]|uniref:hypothetical protein n=1 Tax=Shewanella oncorhynchi TaxID=2726434 RepID=UPI003D798969